jgi:hypothetical protein
VPKIKIEKQLYQKIKEHAESAGYSSLEEFVHHVLEREIRVSVDDDNDPLIMDRLKGLGYIE